MTDKEYRKIVRRLAPDLLPYDGWKQDVAELKRIRSGDAMTASSFNAMARLAEMVGKFMESKFSIPKELDMEDPK